MARFRFRLQAVQELRHHAEKEQQDELLREKQRLDGLQEESDRLAAAFSHWSLWYLENSSHGMPAAEIVRLRGYLDELARRIRENAAQVERQQSAVERARTELVERMRERRTVDMLRDRKFAEYRLEESRRADKELEDWMACRA